MTRVVRSLVDLSYKDINIIRKGWSTVPIDLPFRFIVVPHFKVKLFRICWTPLKRTNNVSTILQIQKVSSNRQNNSLPIYFLPLNRNRTLKSFFDDTPRTKKGKRPESWTVELSVFKSHSVKKR